MTIFQGKWTNYSLLITSLKKIYKFIHSIPLTYIYIMPVKSVVYLFIWHWPKMLTWGQSKEALLWCFFTLISTTLSLNCTVLSWKQRNPDSKSQSWCPGNNSHTWRTFVWWRKSTACWGSHCPRKAGTGSPEGLGPAVVAATVAGAPVRLPQQPRDNFHQNWQIP